MRLHPPLFTPQDAIDAIVLYSRCRTAGLLDAFVRQTDCTRCSIVFFFLLFRFVFNDCSRFLSYAYILWVPAAGEEQRGYVFTSHQMFVH